jgi:hypothetical protein
MLVSVKQSPFLNFHYLLHSEIKMKLFNVTLCSFCLTFLLSSFAAACSCAPPPPPKDALKTATAVFQAKVTKIEKGERTYTVTFEVSRSWKGISSDTVVVKTATDGAACGFGFEVDKEYLVYCYGKADTGLQTNICTRTRTLEFAKEDIEALGEGTAIEKP